MPYVKVLNSPGLPFMYNVRAAVGPNAPNERADVMLVQYLLRAVEKNRVTLGHAPLPSGRTILVDGVCGSITNEAVLHFQKSLKAKNQPIAADGRVDRAYPGVKTPHGLQWTVVFLNFALRHAEPAKHTNLPAAADCPPDLREALL